MASLCTRIQVYPDVWRPSPRKRCKNGSGHLSKCGCRCNGSLCWPWILFLFGAPPPTHETMPKLIRAPFQMRLQLKQDYILATYIMLVWRPPPRKRCKNESGRLSKCGSRSSGSLFGPPTSFWFGYPPLETMPKWIRAHFKMRLPLKRDSILTTRER